jgi:mitotic-spindle organizing protein 1
MPDRLLCSQCSISISPHRLHLTLSLSHENYLICKLDMDMDESIETKNTVLYEMSQLMNTGLDRETLTICVRMIESGVNPEALAVSVLPFSCNPFQYPDSDVPPFLPHRL